MSVVVDIAGYLRPYNNEIAIAIVATALIIFGGAFNTMVRNMVKTWNVLLRVTVFVLLCAFGYGFLTVWLTGWLQGYLRNLSADMFLLQLALVFVMIGIMSERNNWK